MWYFYLLGLMMVFFVLLTTIVAAVEKRLVWPYVPERDAPPGILPPLSTYASVAGSAAAEAGFIWLGTYADGKGKAYKIRYDFFIAPEGDVLALVGSGTMAAIPTRSTWLYTFLTDGGKCLVTVDHQNAVETDLTGMASGTLRAGLGFYALLQAHRARTAGAAVKPFTPPDPLVDFRAYREARLARMHALGYAVFLNADRTSWRYSPKGAFVLAFRQYFAGLRRSFIPDNIRAAKW